jgi:hypothetical protein
LFDDKLDFYQAGGKGKAVSIHGSCAVQELALFPRGVNGTWYNRLAVSMHLLSESSSVLCGRLVSTPWKKMPWLREVR